MLMNPWCMLPTFVCLVIGFGYTIAGARCGGRGSEHLDQYYLGIGMKWFAASWVLNVLIVLGRWVGW